MKKRTSIFAALLAAVVMTVALITGCGSSAPTAKDAQAYVQAMLDLMCLGDYDHSVKLVDVEEGKETELRDNMIDEMLATFGDENGLSDEVIARFRDFMINAFGKAKYTVGEATKTDDGGFDVQVTVEPLKIYGGVYEQFQETFTERYENDLETIAAMSEQELNDLIMNTLIDILNEKLENPTYAAPEEVTVHYGLLDEKEKIYGCTEEDGEKIGSLIFSMEGLE